MGEILNKFIDWIKDASISISKKAIFITLGIIIIILVNEYTGFIYYYPLAKEAEMIYHLEMSKEHGKDNPKLVEYINTQEQKIIDRRYIYEPIADAIKSIEIPSLSSLKNISEDKEIPKVIEEKNETNRSLFWHLITSSGILILISILLVVVLIVIPFTKNKDKWSIWFGSIVLIIPLVLLILFIQFIWGLVPILGHVGVNYTIQIIMQLLATGGLISLGNKEKAK